MCLRTDRSCLISDDQLRAKRHDLLRIEYQTIVYYMKSGHRMSECVVRFDSSANRTR